MKIDHKRLKIGGMILAGGQARRLGGLAKGCIEVDRCITIIERLIKELIDAGISKIVISANDSKPYLNYGVEVIADIRKNLGPVGGIETGLQHFA